MGHSVDTQGVEGLQELGQELLCGVRHLGGREAVLQGLAFVHDLNIPCCQKVKLFSEGVVLGCVGGVGLSGFSVQKGMCDMPQFSRVIEGPG